MIILEKNKELPNGWVETNLENLITRISNGTTEKQSKEMKKARITMLIPFLTVFAFLGILIEPIYRESLKDKAISASFSA